MLTITVPMQITGLPRSAGFARLGYAKSGCQPSHRAAPENVSGPTARHMTWQRFACSGRSSAVKPVAATPIQQLQQIFSRGSPYKSASKEMQAMIQEGSDDAERFGELVDVLLDSELPFKEASLGGGEWQAGQDFDPSERSVLNKGELLGSQVVVTAQGSYEPQDSHTNLPKLVKANITGGQIQAWGRTIPLPISGTGFFSIMYVDDAVRVFSDQKKGTVSVQLQADKLRQLTSAE